jgi:hypothetical protein
MRCTKEMNLDTTRQTKPKNTESIFLKNNVSMIPYGMIITKIETK